MTVSRPTHTPEWAASDSAIVRPSAGLRETGYQPEQGLGSREHNGVLRELNEWVEYLDDGHTPQLDTLEDVHAFAGAGTLPVGRASLVRAPQVARGTAVLTTLGAAPTGVCADTRHAVSCIAGSVVGRNRSTGAAVWTRSLALSGAEGPVSTDGRYIAVASAGGEAAVIDAVDGDVVSSALTVFGAAIKGIAVRGNRVVIVGDESTGGDSNLASVRVFAADTGGQVGFAATGGDAHSVVAHGDHAWVHFDDSGPVVRRYLLSDGSSSGSAGSSAFVGPTQLATDGVLLYGASTVSGGVNSLRAIDPFDYSRVIWSVGAGGADGYTHICVDHRYVYAVRATESIVRAFDKRNGVQVDQVTVAGGIVSIACDGQYVWVAATTGGNRIHRVRLGFDRARLWTVADTTDTFRPFGWSLLPGD